MNISIRNTLYAKRYTLYAIILFCLILPQAALAATITATAGTGGSISPNGAVTVNEGEDITFAITPNNGYVVSDINVDGCSQGAASSYTLYRVNTNLSIAVRFIPAANPIAETIYVDNTLSSNCLNGEYSIANRNNFGSDGNAYKTIGEAANIAGPGDTVLIRAGTYNAYAGQNDVLWPKHSGTPDKPIIFKPYNNEEVILGRHPTSGGSYPNDSWFSIARGVISMRNVSNIIIEGLKIDQVAGWVYARDCRNITIKNCEFSNALWDWKGTARFIECNNNKIINNSFIASSGDSLQLMACNYNLIENNTFIIAKHALLAIRAGNYNVIRNNYFTNPWYENGKAEKLVEVYDWKLDAGDPISPSYLDPPQYDNTKHNLFEDNLFGYHPDYPPSENRGSRTSAIQFSGQNTIIRKNRFSNPPLTEPDPYYPEGYAGGIGLIMRWGGSWEGWDGTRIVGEGHEAGFVYGNRIYNNAFYGYDNGKISIPADNAMSGFPTYAPMKNVANYQDYPFDHTWKFADNVFKNNIFSEGRILPRNTWSSANMLKDTPTQIIMGGLKDKVYFENNNFFGTGQYPDQLIYDGMDYPYKPAKTPSFFNLNQPQTFVGNIQNDPDFIDASNNGPGNDFHINSTSQMIDAGVFVAKTVSSSSGTTMRVNDAGYFYDGYGIEGEAGDIVQLQGQTVTAKIAAIDYTTNTLTLDQPLTWTAGQGVGLAYSGAAPDIGAYEYVPEGTVLYGDVSGDGKISAYDAALTAQAAVGLITLTPEQTKAADVSGDKEVSAYDAALIAQRAVGLIEKFPVEE